MNYTKSLEAMHKAGRVMATAVTPEQRKIAKTYINRAVDLCEEEKPPYAAVNRAWTRGTRGFPVGA